MPGKAFRKLRSTGAAVIPFAAAGLLSASLISLGPPARAASTATINGGTTYQKIDGFGVSEGFGQASTLMNSSGKTQALNYLFSTSGGAGLDILRNEISADSGTTIEPTAPSSPAAAPTYISLASAGNDGGQLTLAQAIKAAPYNVTNVYADAWTAPAFMKTNNATDNGGALCGLSGATCSSGDWTQAYANYLEQYAADYAAAGVPLSSIGPENEANLSTSYDSMQLSPAQTAQFLDTLGPTMAASGLSTKVECCATEGWDYASQYAQAIEADATANANTAVFTSHGYTSAPTSPLSGWSKPAWQTEWSTFENWDAAWDDNSPASGLTWAQHIFAGLDQANLNAFLYWWGSSTPTSNGDNESLIQINGGTVTPSGRLWAFANFSDYVRPGAVRVAASDTADSNITLDAFKNSDGSIAIVALNTGTSADPVTFSLSGTGMADGATVTPHLTNAANSVATQATTSVSGGAFTGTIPARSLETFTIPASASVPPPPVGVTSPGDQTSTVGTAVSVQLQATDSSGSALTWSATGLPPGLSIGASTGLISGTPTTAGTYSPQVFATDSGGQSGGVSFTWTVNPQGGTHPGTACQVTYTTTSQWTGGFTANVTITNVSTTAVNGWKLTFTFPGDQKITNAWNGIASQSGEDVTITNASYNGSIPAGASTQLGFQGTWTSSDAAPTAFTLNYGSCR